MLTLQLHVKYPTHKILAGQIKQNTVGPDHPLYVHETRG